MRERYDDVRQATQDFPCVTILKEKRVRARFPHSCSCCGQGIAKGEMHMYFAFVDDDSIPRKFHSEHMHLFCEPY